jgi:D-alanyl-D-alanine carboxypeptidase (penicillin-binding protein 5/6)
MFRKYLHFLVCFGVFFAPMKPTIAKLKIQAKYAAVLDINSKQWIYEKEADTPTPPASTTKLLTAMVLLDAWPLTHQITIPASVKLIPPYKLHVQAGEKYTVEDLLYGLLMRSANDVAYSLAVRKSGSETKFSVLMNQKSKQLGALHSHFENAHGLPNDKQVVTARDMARITLAASRYPKIHQILSTKNKMFLRPHSKKKTNLVNRNKLLIQNFTPSVYGKTGFTDLAGRCFAGYTTGKTPMVIVVMNSKDRWGDVKKLAQWSASFYSSRIASNKNRMSRSQLLHCQKRLIELGFLTGNADGRWGPESEAALLKFQGNRAKTVDGLIRLSEIN